MLEECGLPYRVHKIDIGKGDQFTPEYVAINPNSKIPSIVDPEGPDGRPLTLMESGAILVYLAGKTGKFLPRTPRGKYDALQWLMFQMGGVGPTFGQAHHFMRAKKDEIPYGSEGGWPFQMEGAGDLLGGLPRPPQVAGPDGIEPDGRQTAGQEPGLLPPPAAEGRVDAAVAERLQARIGVGVADQPDLLDAFDADQMARVQLVDHLQEGGVARVRQRGHLASGRRGRLPRP